MEEEIWEQWEGHRCRWSSEEMSLDMAIKQQRWKQPNEEGHEITESIVITRIEGESSISSPAISSHPGNFCSLLVGKV